MNWIKPFPYDAIETETAILLVYGYQGADGRPARLDAAPGDLSIGRADGTLIRFINLHPRLAAGIHGKPLVGVELEDASAITFLIGASGARAAETVGAYVPAQFYWFLGPETASLSDVADRPVSKLFQNVLRQPLAVAPGHAFGGPAIGMCQTRRGVIVLAPARRWGQARPGLVIDLDLAAGTATGFPANDNISECVIAAHDSAEAPPQHQPRRAWRSQIACAFPREAG
ncbi:hypothetical protein [Sphingosinicella sp. BN140058]|uniref:hypothetical protein n=1 Tax=Sphingosinicella sp. BN140058 TaxID=1892855 RepID=UPI001012BA32|nr:hypothetical protein [Sphingosinicella sp. BN140058]QAY80164.1 hypothetical protein ETR14_26335 [Sphingosinicella sp. BN140058]